MLRTLMLRKKIVDAKKELDDLKAKTTDFDARSAELQKREAEIASAIEEANTDEEKKAVEDAADAYDSDKATLEADQNENAKKIEDLEGEISEMEQELEKLENQQNAGPEDRSAKGTHNVTRSMEDRTMIRRFRDMTHEERSAFVAQDEVKKFLERTRDIMQGTEARDVTGGEYLIPSVVLDIIRANVEDYSKLISKVNLQKVPGKARQTIMGLIPEAVWTEQCGKLNELNFSFGQVEVDGFKVGGFVAVCNALLEDSDINLLNELVVGIGQAIAYALDKAVLYGTGVKMPTGIFKAIDADTTVKGTNVIKHAGTVKGVDLFKAILADTKVINKKYGKAGLTWVMSSSTYTDLQIEAMGINAAGAIVSGMNTTMPVVGGEVVILDFIPAGTIFVGCFDNYLLAERAGASIKKSEEVHFIEDQTVIKGTARYDGKPVIVAAFAIIGIGGANPAVGDVTFAPDTANPAKDDSAEG